MRAPPRGAGGWGTARVEWGRVGKSPTGSARDRRAPPRRRARAGSGRHAPPRGPRCARRRRAARRRGRRGTRARGGPRSPALGADHGAPRSGRPRRDGAAAGRTPDGPRQTRRAAGLDRPNGLGATRSPPHHGHKNTPESRYHACRACRVRRRRWVNAATTPATRLHADTPPPPGPPPHPRRHMGTCRRPTGRRSPHRRTPTAPTARVCGTPPHPRRRRAAPPRAVGRRPCPPTGAAAASHRGGHTPAHAQHFRPLTRKRRILPRAIVERAHLAGLEPAADAVGVERCRPATRSGSPAPVDGAATNAPPRSPQTTPPCPC